MTTTITSQAVTDWVKVFPKNATETYASSVTFMKQLTVVALSTITYLKNVFPDDSYMVENFAGLKIRILKKTCRDELAQFVSTALRQSFDAFDKKYLQKLALCFYEGECKPENLIEYHVFEYSYNPEGMRVDVHSKSRDSAERTARYSWGRARERTLLLLKACVVLMEAGQTELPDSYDVSLRLYYNDSAPDGYQAPGFVSTLDPHDHLQATVSDAIRLGYVETPYHNLTVRTFIKNTVESSHEAIPSQNPPQISQTDQGAVELEEINESEPGETRVRCPCNMSDVEDGDEQLMLTCQYCGKQQHASCFGVCRGAARVSRHCCATCADADAARAPTDARLAELSGKKRECLCIFRRTLEWCWGAGAGVGGGGGGGGGAVCAAQLVRKFRMSRVNASKLMRLLHHYGIIAQEAPSDLTTPREIVFAQLNSVMSKFFQTEQNNIVDRLLTETFSQESQPDPVGDVLGPMGKVSLQNATTIGRIIEPEKREMIVEDSTLRQYREAILSNQQADEQLPLSGSHNPVKDIENIGQRKSIKRKIKDPIEKPLRTGVRTKRAK